MTLQNAPPGLDYERDKRFSKVYLVLLKTCHLMLSLWLKHNFRSLSKKWLPLAWWRIPKNAHLQKSFWSTPSLNMHAQMNIWNEISLLACPLLENVLGFLRWHFLLSCVFIFCFTKISFCLTAFLTLLISSKTNLIFRWKKQTCFYKIRHCMRTRISYHRSGIDYVGHCKIFCIKNHAIVFYLRNASFSVLFYAKC